MVVLLQVLHVKRTFSVGSMCGRYPALATAPRLPFLRCGRSCQGASMQLFILSGLASPTFSKVDSFNCFKHFSQVNKGQYWLFKLNCKHARSLGCLLSVIAWFIEYFFPACDLSQETKCGDTQISNLTLAIPDFCPTSQQILTLPCTPQRAKNWSFSK